MKKINDVREWALKRGEHFLNELRNCHQDDKLSIEAQIYTIMRTFESAYNQAHEINKGTMTYGKAEQ